MLLTKWNLFQVIAFDELKTDYKNPIDQCNSLNPVSKALTIVFSCDINQRLIKGKHVGD